MTTLRCCCFVTGTIDLWSAVQRDRKGRSCWKHSSWQGKHSELFCCCLNLKIQIGVGRRKECFPSLGVGIHSMKDIQVPCVSNLKYSRNFSRNYAGNSDETSSLSYLNPSPGQGTLPNEHLTPSVHISNKEEIKFTTYFWGQGVWNSLVFVISLLKTLLVTVWLLL